MSQTLNRTVAAIVISTAASLASLGHAQDIEFMGKNGERVELKPNIQVVPEVPPRRVPLAAPGNGIPALGGLRGATASSLLGGLPSLKGRTLVVTTPEGDTKEISTDDARSITINRSFSSINRDGQQQLQQGGTAKIVAADGQTYEVDLSQLQDGDQETAGETDQPLQAKQIKVAKSFMIGVFCEPVPEMLSSQLDLGQDVGLIVKEVQDGSPASISGVKKHDVLLYADDQVLGSIKDLADVIAQSGANDQPFSLTVMRAGNELPIEVTAVERENNGAIMPGRMPLGGLRMNDFGPGLIFEEGFGGGFDDGMMEQMRNHMQQVREEMKRMDGLLQKQGLPLPLPNLPPNNIR